MNTDILARETQDYLKSLTVLYVEDEDDSRKQCSEFLSRLAGVLVTAQNGEAGLDAWRQHKPDIIITDIQMPVMDGLAMLQEIRTVDRAVPVIIMSAFEEPKYLKRSIELGVSGYVIKPVDMAIFTNSLLKCAKKLLVEDKLVILDASLRETEKRFQALFDGAGEGICVLNADGMLIKINESMARMHGYTLGEMLQMGLKDLDTPETACLAPERIMRLLEGECLTFEVEHFHKDGHIITLEVSAGLISFGGESYIQCFHRDITDRKIIAEELLNSELFLRKLTDVIPGMLAYWNTELRCTFSNSVYKEWFGKTVEQMRGIHIRELMGEALYLKSEAHILAALQGVPHSFERTMTKVDGSIGHTIVHYIPDLFEFEAQGVFVMITDVTEIKLAEIALQERNKELGCLYSIISMSNNAGFSFDDLLKKAVVRIHSAWQFPDITEVCIKICGKSFETACFQETPWMLTKDILSQDSKVGTVQVCYLEERMFLKEELMLLSAIADEIGFIVVREFAREAIARLAVTDELTGLNNRRFFIESFSKTVSAAQRHKQPLSLISIDLDYFKKVNDTFGHSVGDLVLKEFSTLLKMMVRVEDVACRLGGEEFMILLPHTTGEASIALAERIRFSFEQLPRTATPVVTASFGVAQLREGEDEDALMRRVDDALYQAKHEGRNRVVAACDATVS